MIPVRTGTYQWGSKRPGWTYYPVAKKSGHFWTNTLWRRSRIRVSVGWLLYWSVIAWLVWLCA